MQQSIITKLSEVVIKSEVKRNKKKRAQLLCTKA